MFQTQRLLFCAALPVLAANAAFALDGKTGPSSSQSAYVVPVRPGVLTKSLLTVGDAVNYKADGLTPYRLVGIPDGMGAYDNGDGTFTVLLNHELPNNRGIVRAHGFIGSFISKWVIDKESATVLSGEDLIKSAYSYVTASGTYVPLTSAISRLCSADLPELTAFYNSATALGYNGRIFMNGEESGATGRAFAHFLDGNSYELPHLGKYSWENSVAHPNTGDKTIVVGLDDSGGGQVYIYTGSKSASPDRVAAAGLSGGVLGGIKVQGVAFENDNTAIAPNTPFTLANLGDVSAIPGNTLEANSVAAGITGFNRPEDGAWDPSNPNDFYFVTTASFTGRSRLWRLTFVDPSKPELGGTATILIDGSNPAGPKMMDNMTITSRGSVFIQEDPGGQDYLAKVWRYSIGTGALEIAAQHDPARFTPGAAGFLTRDEESSGILPLDDILGEGWSLLNVQAHYATDPELVEGGQLLLMRFAPGMEKK